MSDAETQKQRRCSVAGCDAVAKSWGCCPKHYARWKRHGDPRVRLKCDATQHGHAKKGATTKTYRAWRAMLARCYMPGNNAYERYGGAGIVVCDRWRARRTGFVSFLSDLGAAPSPAHTLDRIRVDGNYEPGNCRWATMAEQNRNKRTSIRIDGVHVMDWCETHGTSYRKTVALYRQGVRGDALIRAARS